MRRLFSTLLFSVLSVTGAWAQTEPSLDGVRDSARRDLEAAIQRYAALQESIKEEKIPLNRQLNELNDSLRQMRSEAERARRLRDNSSVDLNSLRERVAKREEQITYVANLVSDFGERFERDIDLSERQLYTSEIDAFQASLDAVVQDEGLGKGAKLVDQLAILQTSLRRFQDLLGGETFPGKAVVQGGAVEAGTFVAVGPSYFFASSESPFAGLVMKSSTSSLPPVASIGPEEAPLIQSVAKSGSGVLPIDATLGSAQAIAAEAENFWDISHLEKGGVWIIPILVFAALATLTAVFKLFEVFSVKMPPVGALHDIVKALNEGDREKARRLAEAIPGPSRGMLIDAVDHADESKELMEEVMYERMLEVQPKLERLLPFIAVTAATAPLMGLLGTVTGMINTFKLITVFGTGDAKQLSSGISEALITTEWGLIVAIPALVMHALLNRRVQGILARMERMAVAFINGLNRRN